MTTLFNLIWAVPIILILLILLYLYPVLEFDGTSMYPTFHDGDKVRCSRVFSRKNLKVGKVYVYYREDEGKRYLVVKRLSNICCDHKGEICCYFLGDNRNVSLDSRHYGWINSKNIVAIVTTERR